MTRRTPESIAIGSLGRAQRLALRKVRGQRRLRRATVLVVALTVGLFGAQAASAYFGSGGSGTGSATGGTLQALTVTATGTVTSQLLPGGTADLHLVVANPNAFPVIVTGVTQTALSTITVTGALGSCTAANSGVSVSVAQPSLPVTITAVNGGTQTLDLSSGASMAAGSATGCQQASFGIPVTLSVRKS